MSGRKYVFMGILLGLVMAISLLFSMNGSFGFDARKESGLDGAKGIGTTKKNLADASVTYAPSYFDSKSVTSGLKTGSAVIVTLFAEESGRRISAEDVSLVGKISRTQTTNIEGKAVFEGISGGTYLISVDSNRYAAKTRRVSVPEGVAQAVEFQLAVVTGTSFSGIVLDEQAHPIQGAKVEVFEKSIGVFDSNEKLFTKTDGTFAIDILGPGSYMVFVRHKNYVYRSIGPVNHSSAHRTSGIRIVLDAGAEVSGIVLKTDGSRAARCMVFLSPPKDDPKRYILSMALTRTTSANDYGFFRFIKVPREKMVLYAKSDEGISDNVQIDLENSTEVDNIELRLDTSGIISGKVVDHAGQGIAGVSVYAFEVFENGNTKIPYPVGGMNHTVTSRKGNFSIHGLADGTFRLEASRSGCTYYSYGGNSVIARTGKYDVTIVMGKAGGLKGRLKFFDGTYPQAFSVKIIAASKFSFLTSDGSFEIKGLPAGKLSLKIEGDDFATKVLEKISIAESETTDLGEIELWTGRTIRGLVVDRSKRAIEGAKVAFGKTLIGDAYKIAAPTGGEIDGVNLKTTYSDSGGNFEIKGIDSVGGVVLADHLVYGRSRALKIQDGDEDVEVTLMIEEVGKLYGRVLDDGTPVVGRIEVTNVASPAQHLIVGTSPTGQYSIERVSAGQKTVLFSRTEFASNTRIVETSISKMVDLVVGGNMMLDFDLSKANRKIIDLNANLTP